MTLDEAIERERRKAEEQRIDNENCEYKAEYGCKGCADYYSKPCIECAEEHEQLAEWLEELKALREYKKKMEMQYLDDIDNPLEPLKLQSALQSEIFKFNYRKEHKPQDINILDYTVMSALKYCLEEQLKAGRENENYNKES